MEHKVPLLPLQEPVNGPYAEPDQSSPRPTIPLPKDPY
jgi:hypothetical protein